MIDHPDQNSSADDTIASLVHDAAPTRFDAGFADRVVARLGAGRELPLSAALERQVRRVVPIAAAASLMLAAYNWWGARESASSPLEAALNLPSVTLSAAYAPSALFGATSVTVEYP
jgi:hypothetical protein